LALAAAAGLAALSAAPLARADDGQEIELGKSRFDAGRYDEAHARFTAMLDAALPSCDAAPSGSCRITDPDLIERARALDGAALVALKRYPEAEARVEAVLRQNPTYTPNPMLFPQEVVDRFAQVRARLRDELAKQSQARTKLSRDRQVAMQKLREAQEKWLAELERLASREKRVEVHSRWVALLPLGIGQYQNGDMRLGAFFSASEVLLGATTLVTAGLVATYGNINRRICGTRECLSDVQRNIDIAALVNRIAFSAWIGVTVAGIAQAELQFVPERITYKTRPLPPRPRLGPAVSPSPTVAPTVSFLPGGFSVGVVGQF
jgi:tetratricopeptide (TPR) repeat protein